MSCSKCRSSSSRSKGLGLVRSASMPRVSQDGHQLAVELGLRRGEEVLSPAVVTTISSVSYEVKRDLERSVATEHVASARDREEST